MSFAHEISRHAVALKPRRNLPLLSLALSTLTIRECVSASGSNWSRCHSPVEYVLRQNGRSLPSAKPSLPNVSSLILTEVRANVLHVGLNRPSAQNAITLNMRRELDRCFVAAQEDRHVSVVVISGSGPHFSRGMDMVEAFGMSGETAAAMGYLPDVSPLRNMTKPTICAVEGMAKGFAVSLVEACDFCVAGEAAHFQHDEVLQGLLPAGGTLQNLTRLIGLRRATSMLLGAWPMDAQQALRAGLVSRVVGQGQALANATSLAADLARLSRPVLSEAKRLLQSSLHQSPAAAFSEESETFFRLFSLDDRIEGTSASLQHREPLFKHR